MEAASTVDGIGPEVPDLEPGTRMPEGVDEAAILRRLLNE